MNLTENAKETAKYLVDLWNETDVQEWIYQRYNLNGEDYKSHISHGSAHMFQEHYVEYSALIELNRESLLQFEYTRDRGKVILLQNLRDAVKNNFSSQTAKERVVITHKHEQMVQNLLDSLPSELTNGIQKRLYLLEKYSSHRRSAKEIAKKLLGENSIIYFELSTSNHSLSKFQALLEELLNQIKLALLDTSQASKGNISKTFGEVSTSPQFQCDIFMIMPFREPFWKIYQKHTQSVIENQNLVVKTGKDVFSDKDVMNDIWSLTNNAKIVIADCTGRNANVFYEIGIAHTLGKPVIPITQSIEDIPFDIRHRRVIEYSYPDGMEKFEGELGDAIQKLLGEL
ncbi:MAG: hypothetical protein AAF846_13935 [Chloroflexota bacterium]